MRTQNTIILAVTIALLAACGSKDKIGEIKSKIEALKKQQSEIKGQISQLEKELKDAGYKDSTNVKVKEVAVAPIQAKEFRHYLEVQGKVDSDKNVLVSYKAAGTVTRILVNKGDYVRAGSTLLTIDDEAMRKGVQELKTNLELSKTVYEKQKSLWDQKIGTEIQYLQAKASYEGLQNRLSQMNEQLDAYRVKAPIDGTVDEIYPNEGELASPGMPAVRIVNTTGFKVTADIAEGYIGKVKKGNKASIYFPDINYTMETYVKVVSDVINTVNRTFTVEFDLKNAPKDIKANMLAYVKIQDYSEPNAIVIPVNVIQHSETNDFVFTVKNNKAVKTPVKVGGIYRTEAEILSGLKEGDQVITLGYQDVLDGQNVKF
ncbi:MAG TPA: efflux RND transporter periplasmic adaptor subunit [Cytophagaceae bacterium]|nr:efflux RND transporter periplasmic adaptor subunit [Cytophagaceae bacterium]